MNGGVANASARTFVNTTLADDDSVTAGSTWYDQVDSTKEVSAYYINTTDAEDYENAASEDISGN